MKLGIFGDSYAMWHLENQETHLWWTHFKKLLPKYQITNYAYPGSSIDFSINELLENHERYDFCIWCVTSSNRRSSIVAGRWYHFIKNGPDRNQITSKPMLPYRLNHVYDEMYAMFRYTHTNQEWKYKACVDYALKTIRNLMVIPCFKDPLETDFCLTDISQWEWNHYFPDQDFSNLYKTYEDLRHGHLTRKNSMRLAELIAKDLRPGIFRCNLSDFQIPDQPVEECFRKIKTKT